MAALLRAVALLFFLHTAGTFSAAAATWCVARSDASDEALQSALDYACWAGADCAPIQSSGLCYLPNTVQAHASYAFNSYYQRRGNAPGSCSFGGTATVAKTDPSYGSCIYPSSPSTAGGSVAAPGSTTTTSPGGTPATTIPPPPPGATTPFYGTGGGGGVGGSGGLSPPMGPVTPDSNNSNAFKTTHAIFLLVFSFILQTMWCKN